MHGDESSDGNGVDKFAILVGRVDQHDTDLYGRDGMRVDIAAIKVHLRWLLAALALILGEGVLGQIARALGWW